MSKTEKYRAGQYFPLPVPSTLTGAALTAAQAARLSSTPAGTPLKVGLFNVVTVSERSDTEKQFGNHLGEASCDLGGVHILPVTITAGPLTAGQQIYLVTADGTLSTVASGGTAWGVAVSYGVPNGVGRLIAVRPQN